MFIIIMDNKITIKVIGNENINWSIDKDNDHIKYFISKMENATLVSTEKDADVLFFTGYGFISNLSKSTKIISAISNNITIYKEKFLKLKPFVDIWVSPNSTVSKFLDEQSVKFIQIPFFVSGKIFNHMAITREAISKKLNINYTKIKDKVLIGSFQRDSLGNDLTKPKWQKNPDLLISICKKLPKNKFILLLAGPRRHYIINQCKKFNIPYLFIGNEKPINRNQDDISKNILNEYSINLLYNLIDVYIVSSKTEGGPKAIMESCLTKTPIFSTDVGLAKDFLHEDLIYDGDDISKIIDFIKNKRENTYIEYNYAKAYNILNENAYLKLYENLIEAVI